MENKFTNIKERVVQVAEKQGISKERFFMSIGMTSASFRGKAKDTPLNSNAIVNIITKYPKTDLHWLLTGEYRSGEYPDLPQVNESSNSYGNSCRSCDEKEEIIKLLKSQVKDLRSDKEDLKKLLGLAKENS
ncbi:MAG: hypothetical protein JKY02_07805 [Flavobacteriaceae bacterium]|nr:hypothetical protein [Flavobacteriaceae bacterium]